MAKRLKIAAAAAGVCLLVAAAVFIARSGRGISSGVERLDYLRTVAVMCAEHPLTGGGWGSFFQRHMKIKLTDSDESARSPHNLPGTFAAQAGIPAGLIAAAAMILLLWELFRVREPGPVPGAARWGVLAFMLHSCMELNDAIPASVAGCLIIALALLPREVASGAPDGPGAPALPRKLSLYALALVIGLGGFWSNWTWVRSEAAFDELDRLLHPRNPAERVGPPDPGAAFRALRRVEELRPRSPYAAEMTGDLLFRMGDLENAVVLFEKARERDPGRPAVWRRLAAAAFRRGDLEEARRLLGVARALFPADPKNREEIFFKPPEGER